MQAQSISGLQTDERSGSSSQAGWATRQDLVALPILLIIWMICHPYFGNNRGSLIYTARALADLDPAGVGQDAMFRLDGQSGLTIFTPILRMLTATFGESASSMGVALTATLAYFAASVALAWRIAEGRLRYAIVVFMAALPNYYGGYRIFNFAEASATPRPFAEALVIFAIAAFLGRRHIVAFLCVGLATVIHPIMALPGVAAVLICLALEDKRWIAVMVALVALTLAAAAAGVEPFRRIWVVIDPEWKTILVERNPHLFPGLWLKGSIGHKFAQFAILLTAASLVEKRVRNLFLVVAAVGALGVAVAWALGEKMSLLLVIQAQTWRMMWLVFAIVPVAMAICVVGLWKRDYNSRLALVFLGLALVFSNSDLAGFAFAATALVLRFTLDPADNLISKRGFSFAFAVVTAFLLLGLARTQWEIYTALDHIPPDIVDELRRTLTVSYDFMPFALAAGVWALTPRVFSSRVAVAALAAVGAFFLVASWDRRSGESRFLDSSGPLPDLEKLVAAKPGEIYWVNGVRESWSWLGRANWVSAVQGASIVFSRDLAIQYRDRARRVISLQLADDEIITPLTEPHLREIPPLTGDKLDSFCAWPDAPAWIVAPLVKDATLAPDIRATLWTAPVEKIEILDRDGQIGWRRISRYAIIPCAK